MKKNTKNMLEMSEFSKRAKYYREMERFVIKFKKYYNQPLDYLKKYNISATEANILVFIAEEPGITPSELSEIWGSTSGAIAQMLKKLESKNYIRREKHKGNAKSVHIYVTEQGQEVFKEHTHFCKERSIELTKKLEDMCTIEDSTTFFRILKICNDYVM